MIYVPMLKTRREELSVSKKLNYCFSDNIIPLFEILTDKYETRYEIDAITKSFVYELKGKRRMRKKAKPTDSDIITLDYINRLIENRKAFIDYFRFSIEKYSRNVDIGRTDLAWKLSHDSGLYKKKILEISKYKNLIPTISIKPGFHFKKNELESFIMEIQDDNEAIGLRITEEWFKEDSEIIKKTLRKTDFLLFDIGEQNPSSKIMEFYEIEELGTNATTILLNSPRKAKIVNGEYVEHGITELIDNSAKELYKDYGFEGFGDYCGLKDSIPLNDKSNGKGTALVLLYDYKENSFYSFLHPDSSQGVNGYYQLIPVILNSKSVFDPFNNCPAINKIENLKGPGNWSTWHNINITRYIHQMYSNL